MRGSAEMPELLLPMLPDLSITSSTSLSVTGTAPHGPPHAAEETAPELPFAIPTTGAKAYWVVELPTTTTTLHLSPADGSHGEVRVSPAPVKCEARPLAPSEGRG